MQEKRGSRTAKAIEDQMYESMEHWAWYIVMRERPEDEKSTHARVRYENPAKMPDTTCSNCIQYVNAQPPRCNSVKQPIHPTGWCIRHKKKGKDDPTKVP